MAIPAAALSLRFNREKPPINEKYTLYEPYDFFLKINHCHWVLLGRDRVLASVFAALHFISNGRVIVNNAKEKDEEPWFEATETHISELTMGVSEKTLRGHIHTLAERGFITIADVPMGIHGVTHRYLLNYDAINRAVRGLFPIGKTTDEDIHVIGKTTDDSSVKLPMPIGKTTDAYKEEEVVKNNTEEKDILPISAKENLQTIPIPEGSTELEVKPIPAPADDFASQSYLQLEEDIVTFVKNAYTQSRGAKISKSLLNRYTATLVREESNYSPEEFRTAIWKFLGDRGEWLRENKWPLGRFLQTIETYLPDCHAVPSASPATVTYLPSSEAMEIVPESFQPAVTPLTLLEQWNTIVYELPWTKQLLSFQSKLVEKAIQNPEFMEVWDEVLDKCALIAGNRPADAKPFMWVFESTQAGPNWHGLINGKYDWATKTRGSVDIADQAIKNLQREERN